MLRYRKHAIPGQPARSQCAAWGGGTAPHTALPTSPTNQRPATPHLRCHQDRLPRGVASEASGANHSVGAPAPPQCLLPCRGIPYMHAALSSRARAHCPLLSAPLRSVPRPPSRPCSCPPPFPPHPCTCNPSGPIGSCSASCEWGATGCGGCSVRGGRAAGRWAGGGAA